jgi:hypothetical protein
MVPTKKDLFLKKHTVKSINIPKRKYIDERLNVVRGKMKRLLILFVSKVKKVDVINRISNPIIRIIFRSLIIISIFPIILMFVLLFILIYVFIHCLKKSHHLVFSLLLIVLYIICYHIIY